MRRTVTTLLAFTLSALAAGMALAGDLNDEYFRTVGNYFQKPYEEVFAISDEVGVNEVALAYLIAQKGKVSIDKVVELRSEDGNWQSVASDCGLSASDFYMMISGKIESKTFEPIFAKYSATPQFKWSGIEFTDAELVNLANLRTLSSQYDYSVFDIMAMKDIGSDWPRINQKVAVAKKELMKKYVQR